MPAYSDATIAHLKRGPFPDKIDPFAEAGRYFQQIHSGVIGHLLEQIQDPLLSLGYFAGRETSLQVIESREPDLYVHQSSAETPAVDKSFDYGLAAAEVLAEPGVLLLADEPHQQAIYVKEQATGDLVTVVEIVSPHNKTEPAAILHYRQRRERLIGRGVNVVEIDLTRSVKRLFDDTSTHSYPYHAVIYHAYDEMWFIGIAQGDSLPRIALPLRQAVVPMTVQTAYQHAYQVAGIAVQIEEAHHYDSQHLPFPSTLSDAERQAVQVAVQQWQTELQHLRQEGD